VLDTLENFVNEGSQILQDKGWRIRAALVALASAACILAAGILVDTL